MDYIEEPYGCAVSISYPVHFADGSLWIHDAKSENLIRLDVPAG